MAEHNEVAYTTADGNDYPVKALGVECFAVEGWHDTAAYLEKLIPELQAAAAR